MPSSPIHIAQSRQSPEKINLQLQQSETQSKASLKEPTTSKSPTEAQASLDTSPYVLLPDSLRPTEKIQVIPEKVDASDSSTATDIASHVLRKTIRQYNLPSVENHPALAMKELQDKPTTKDVTTSIPDTNLTTEIQLTLREREHTIKPAEIGKTRLEALNTAELIPLSDTFEVTLHYLTETDDQELPNSDHPEIQPVDKPSADELVDDFLTSETPPSLRLVESDPIEHNLISSEPAVLQESEWVELAIADILKHRSSDTTTTQELETTDNITSMQHWATDTPFEVTIFDESREIPEVTYPYIESDIAELPLAESTTVDDVVIKQESQKNEPIEPEDRADLREFDLNTQVKEHLSEIMELTNPETIESAVAIVVTVIEMARELMSVQEYELSDALNHEHQVENLRQLCRQLFEVLDFELVEKNLETFLQNILRNELSPTDKHVLLPLLTEEGTHEQKQNSSYVFNMLTQLLSQEEKPSLHNLVGRLALRLRLLPHSPVLAI